MSKRRVLGGAMAAGAAVMAAWAQPEKAEESGTPAATPSMIAETSAASPAAQPVASANKDHDPSAKAALEAAQKALNEATTLRFSVEFKAEGMGAEYAGTTSARVLAVRNAAARDGWDYRLTGTGSARKKESPTAFDAAWIGTQAEWVDHAAKKLVVKPASMAKGPALAGANTARVSEILNRQPFAQALNAQKLELLAEETIDGVACKVILATGVDRSGDLRLAIGADDSLPRRLSRVRKSQRGDTTMTFEYTGMKAGDPISTDDLRVPLPEGYTRDEGTRAAGSTGSVTPTAVPVDHGAGGVVTLPGTDVARIESEAARAQAMAEQASGAGAGPGVSPGASGEVPRATPEGVATPVQAEPEGHSLPRDEYIRTEKYPDAVPSAASASSSGTVAPPVDASAALTASPASTPAPTPRPERVLPDTMPAFELKTASGEAVSLESLRGQTVLMAFGGSWSLSTRRSLPTIEGLAKEHGAGLRVLAATVRERQTTAGAELVAREAPTVAALSSADELAARTGVRVYPTFVVFGPDGRILKRIEGFLKDSTPAELEDAVRSALGLAPVDRGESTSPEKSEGTATVGAEK